jgi:TRAP-type C4-dicarboxylate transport system permease small subunit
VRSLLDRAAAATALSLAAAGVVCAVAMMVLVTGDVVARYGFNSPTTWADEMASYLLIAIVFLGLAQNLRQGSHIRIDVITGRLPEGARLVLDVVAYAVGVVFSAVLVGGCWVRFTNFWERGTTSDSPLMTPLWIPMVPVLAGALVLALAAVAGFVVHLHALLAASRRPAED